MAKESRGGKSGNFNEKRTPAKKGRDTKKDKKPAFERYRDESRPSEVGLSKTRSTGAKRKPSGDKPSFRRRDEESNERKPYGDKPAFRRRDDDNDRKPSGDKPAFRRRDDDATERKPFGDKPSSRRSADDSSERKPFNKEKQSYSDFKRKSGGGKFASRKRDNDESSERSEKNYDDDFYQSKPGFVRASDLADVDYEQEYQDSKRGVARKPRPQEQEERSSRGGGHARPYNKRPRERKSSQGGGSSMHKSSNDGTVRLNKYIANAGICSRREADDLIASGVVQVNGKVITEMGYKVKPTDVIKYGGQTLRKERLVYLILNKPKDYITTVDDPQQRKTVLELVQGACNERIYPVGRLDRATTGLLMFTNDGEMTKKLTHPRYGVRKIYQVELDKPLKRADLDQIAGGIELEDGMVKVDEISYVGDGKDKSNIGVEIHSGKNRIVRRIFEHFGYNVRKLDRVVFGPLTKKDLPRGRWRFLSESEVGMLKMVSEKKA